MNRLAIIRAAYWAVIAVGDEPSQRTIQEMSKRICGKRFRTAEVLDFLRVQRSLPNRVALGKQSGSDAVAPSVLKNASPVAPGLRNGSRSRAPHKVLELEKTVDSTGDKSPSESTTSQKPQRIRPTAKPLPELPAIVAVDVQRLIANDASKRRDGLIAQSVVDRDLDTLRRAFERKGEAALIDGIEIALRKNKGLRYAAGCVKNHEDVGTTVAQQSLLFGASPANDLGEFVLPEDVPLPTPSNGWSQDLPDARDLVER